MSDPRPEIPMLHDRVMVAPACVVVLRERDRHAVASGTTGRTSSGTGLYL